MKTESNRALRKVRDSQGSSFTSIQASRGPSPDVPPISISGIRYEQLHNGFMAGFEQMGGYLNAVDEATRKRLWSLKVYDNTRSPRMEGDVQDIFFTSMTLQDDGTLLIENERGKHFIVDVVARTSTRALTASGEPESEYVNPFA